MEESVRELFVVACTAGAKEDTLLYHSLQKQCCGDFYFFEHNQRGLPACYNEYLDRFAGSDRILLLVHSDVAIADIFFREKLADATKLFNVIGLAGSSTFDLQKTTPHYAWTVWPRECLSGLSSICLATARPVGFAWAQRRDVA
jgi:hypothetical protein